MSTNSQIFSTSEHQQIMAIPSCRKDTAHLTNVYRNRQSLEIYAFCEIPHAYRKEQTLNWGLDCHSNDINISSLYPSSCLVLYPDLWICSADATLYPPVPLPSEGGQKIIRHIRVHLIQHNCNCVWSSLWSFLHPDKTEAPWLICSQPHILQSKYSRSDWTHHVCTAIGKWC